MATTSVRDVVIWTKHVQGDPALTARLQALAGGEIVELEIDGFSGPWVKMTDGRDGRPTRGLRPVGRSQSFWSELYLASRGRAVEVKLASQASTTLQPAREQTEAGRQAALHRLLNGLSGYRSDGRTLTRDQMHDRELDREEL